MKIGGEARDTLMAWAALAAGAAAWFGSQQLGSNVAFAACHASDDFFPFLLLLVTALLLGTGIFFSWKIWRRGTEAEVRPFIALVGMGCGAVLAIAILLDFLAGLIIPSCFA